jgi:DNA modification methylase
MRKLSIEQIDEIKMLLDSGQEMPEDYRYVLFPPDKRECELVYWGKERKEEILSQIWGVPLQPVRTFGVAKDQAAPAWSNRLIFGDNLQVMKRLIDDPEVCGKVKLVYIDPPFATAREFEGNREQRAYQDKILGAEFIEFLRKRIILLHHLLADNGFICVHLDHKKGHYLKLVLDEVFGEHNFRNHIARVKCNPKNYTTSSFGNVHDFIFIYSKTPSAAVNKVFLDRAALQIIKDFPQVDPKNGKRYKTSPLHAPGIRNGETGKRWRDIPPPAGNHWRYIHSTLDALDNAGQIEWSDNGNPRKKIYEEDSEGYLLQDIWDYKDPGDRNSLYPTQKSEDLLQHIVSSLSAEGDLCLDAFAGSGTTLAVAEKNGRRWIGIDCGKLSIYTIQKRLLNLSAPKRKKVTLKPFTLYNAGLYDLQRMRELPWEEYRRFALQLFQVRDDPHTVSGIKLDGFKDSSDVLVFNFQAHPGVTLDVEYVRELHKHLGRKTRREFFIVAPAASVTFLADYIDQGDTRYYVLRIPYSIIDELHDRPFRAIRQPIDIAEVNATVEAVGFDFIQPPTVKATYKIERADNSLFDQAVVRITEFQSEVMTKSGREFANRETLSMVMVDYDYKGRGEEIFELDAVFYHDQLEQCEWCVALAPQHFGERVMLIYIDIFGNEFREVKTLGDFKQKTEKKSNVKASAQSRAAEKLEVIDT